MLGERRDHGGGLDGAGLGLVTSAAPLGSAVLVVWARFPRPEWPCAVTLSTGRLQGFATSLPFRGAPPSSHWTVCAWEERG